MDSMLTAMPVLASAAIFVIVTTTIAGALRARAERRSAAAATAHLLEHEPTGESITAANIARDQYVAFMRAGFTPAQALTLVGGIIAGVLGNGGPRT